MSLWLQPEPFDWWTVVEDALDEDVGSGDLTAGCFDPSQRVTWFIEAQADGVLCGAGIVEHLLAPSPHDPEDLYLESHCADGERVRRGQRIAEGVQYAQRAMTAERTTLNFLMHLSGVATLTAQFVEKVSGTGAQIVDTRKTLPNLRALQKYAVRCGGGRNHRMGLFDAAMVKDNHIRAAGGISQAVAQLRGYLSHMHRIEVECETLEQVEQAVQARVDAVLLDNMDPFQMREAVKRFAGQVVLEASGGIDLDTVKGVAQTGVPVISVGLLTHSAPSLPFHMELV